MARIPEEVRAAAGGEQDSPAAPQGTESGNQGGFGGAPPEPDPPKPPPFPAAKLHPLQRHGPYAETAKKKAAGKTEAGKKLTPEARIVQLRARISRLGEELDQHRRNLTA